MQMLYTDLRIMRGPNMWSQNYNKLIAIKFDPAAIAGLNDQRQKFIVEYFRENYHLEQLHEDFKLCAFSYTVQLAALLQGEGMYHELAFPSPGIFYGLIAYNIEEAGKIAVQFASGIVESILADENPIPLSEAMENVRSIAREYSEGPTTSLIIDAARKRNIPVNPGPAGYTILGYGINQKRLSAALSHHTTCISVNIAGNKEATKKFLQSAYLPVPKGKLARNENELLAMSEQLGYPLVAKPLSGNQGRNVTTGIDNYESLLAGFRYAKEISKSVIIEKEIKGHDYRLLVIGNKFIAASLRLPAFVTGDGQLTISDLVENENSDPRRGNGHENILTKIKIDVATELCLQKQGRSPASIPEKGQQVFLKLTANLSTGGTAEDVTDLVHPVNRLLAEKVSRIIGLDICGIDIISPDISQPLSENAASIIEVNAAPGLRMHQYPDKGLPRNVGEPLVELMFKIGEEGRIPIVAITGTNGKTTVTRLMAFVASFAGNTVGFTTTDGIYVGGEQIVRGDCSGPQSARTILQDPTVNFAVLECARGGIIRSGLGFDQCDIAIVTNVAADHLGLKDIYTVEDLANVKAVVPGAVKKDGWAILNAADEHTYAMKDKVHCKVGLFCSDEKNDLLQQHINNSGFAVYADAGLDIYIRNGETKIFIVNAAEVPITRNGKAGFMIDNVLPVVLAAYFSGIEAAQIGIALKAFTPSAEQTPGRINEFDINGVNVIVDYAHNPHGLKALAGYLQNIPEKKLGIITGTGDRRDDDIIEFGRIAATMYDDIIIRFDRDTRGRSKESIVALLERGIHEIKPQQEYLVIPDTATAIEYAVANVPKGSYVVICADDAIHTVELTKKIAIQYQS